MEISFITVLISVFSLVMLAVPGFILAKLKMLPNVAKKVLSTFLLYVCQPLLIFMSFQKTEFNTKLGIDMLIVAGIATFVHVIIIAGLALIFKKHSADQKIRVLKYASVFGNCGFMGFPFLQTLFGDNGEVLVFGAVVVAVFNLLSWTVGIYILTNDKKYVSPKKALINPVTISLALGLAVFFIVKVPLVNLFEKGFWADTLIEKLMHSCALLSDMITPLAMTVLGINLANMKFKDILLNKRSYITSFIKLAVMPFIVILVFLVLKDVNIYAKYTVFFTLAMPTATNTMLFCEQYGGDSEEASATVLLSTVLSILTISLMFLAFTGILGL